MRKSVVLLLAGVALAAVVRAQDSVSYRDPSERRCPVLDAPLTSSSGISLDYGFPAETTAPGWNDLSTAELDVWARILNWENESGGDLDLRLQWNTLWLLFGGDDPSDPLTMAAVQAQWSQRFVNGYGLQVDVAPGLYSALESVESDDFSVPFGFTVVQAMNPEMAVFLGVSVYPGFERLIDPRAGVRWSDSERYTIDLAYPETRGVWSPFDGLRLMLGARVSLWPEYNLGDDPRERLRYEEIRAYTGFEVDCGEWFTLGLQGGYLFAREISYENEEYPGVDVDDAPFASVALNGRFW